MKRLLHLVITLLTAAALFQIGFHWRSTNYRINIHENGHITGFQKDGIAATRVDRYTVRGERTSVRGIMGGYETDMDVLCVFIVVTAGIVIALTIFVAYHPLIFTLPAAAWGAYHGINMELSIDNHDIRVAAILMGIDPQTVIYQLSWRRSTRFESRHECRCIKRDLPKSRTPLRK